MPGRVILLWGKTDVPWPADVIAEGLARLPLFMRQEVLRLQRWQDRQARIFDRLLLRTGLVRLNLNDAAHLRGWSRNNSGRPFLQDCPADFNFSHSDGVSVAALTLNGRVGVDIERQTPLELGELKLAFSPDEWNSVLAASEPVEFLLHLWTTKEAVLKADGLGLYFDPAKLDGRGDTIQLGKQRWYMTRPNVLPGWICCLATNWRDPNIKVQMLEMAELLG